MRERQGRLICPVLRKEDGEGREASEESGGYEFERREIWNLRLM